MPAKRTDPAELLRLALDGFDAQIAELQAKRAQLALMIGRSSTNPAVEVAKPQKRRTLSAVARAKISAAAKARWAKKRKGKAEKQKPNAAAKRARAKAKPIEPAPARTKAKKTTTEKDKPTKNDLAKKGLALESKDIGKPKTRKPDVNSPAGIVEHLALAGARFRITRGGSLIIGNLGSLPPDVQRMFLDHPKPYLLTAAAREYLVSVTQPSEK